MSRYGNIDHALANYFAIGVGLSEAEAVESLKMHLSTSPKLRLGLLADLDAASADPTFSWGGALAENDVVQISDEAEAKHYVRQLLCAAAN